MKKDNKTLAMILLTTISALNVTIALASNDEYYGQQWGLENSGQVFRRDVDDVRSENVVGKKGIDIGWAGLATQWNGLLKRDAVIAVLDSGLDLEHPDIKNAIAKNSQECTAAGNIDPGAKEDKDGNGFVGDCMGWNFVAAGNGNARPYDTAGHGTHVAGIISAIASNRIGIAGMGNRLKIIPVKVLEGEADATEIPARTEIFAKGIRYATKRKVDVINISMGWPIAMNSIALKTAINEALASGITIVAAAGNNSHWNPTFPCAMKGVICVGALSPDGMPAEFSNHGGAVDLFAPGEFIYSLYPMALRTKMSGVSGYEIKNGTSQAAPYVSGAVALIRATFPGITNDEIRARLFASAKPLLTNDLSKPTLHGLLNLAGALSIAPRPVVEPIFKEVTQIPFSMGDKNFNFRLPIANYWSAANNVQITLRAPAGGIQFKQQDYLLGGLSAHSETILDVQGSILDPQAHSEVPLAVDVNIDGKVTGTYRTLLFFSRNIDNDPAVSRALLPNIPGFQLTRAGDLRTVSDKFLTSSTPEYFAVSKDAQGGKLLLLRFAEESLRTLTALPVVSIPGLDRVMNIALIDANNDGRPDYFVQALIKEGDRTNMYVYWFNEKMQPLFGTRSAWKIKVEGAALGGNFSWMLTNDSTFGAIRLPVFADTGNLPTPDRYIDPFNPSNSDQATLHLYFLNPIVENGSVSAETRVLDTNEVRNRLRSSLSADFGHTVDFTGLIPQSLDDYKNGKLRTTLLSTLNGIAKTYVASFQGYGDFQLAEIQSQGADLRGDSLLPLRILDGAVADFAAGATFTRFFTARTARTLTLKLDHSLSLQPRKEAEFAHTSGKLDLLLGGLGAFESKGHTYILYQSKQRLLVQHLVSGMQDKVFELPIYRYSFLPGTVFNQMFYPVTYGVGSGRFGAVQIDNTSINRNSIQLVVITPSGLSRPMNMSIAMPDGCSSLNPVRVGLNKEFLFAFQCGNELRYLPMKAN